MCMLSFPDPVLFLSAHISNFTDANSKQLHMFGIKLVLSSIMTLQPKFWALWADQLNAKIQGI